MEVFLMIAVPAVVLAIVAWIGHRTTATHGIKGWSILAGIWLIVSGLLWYGAATAPGWDALLPIIALIFGAAPAGVGLIGGGITGAARRAEA